MHPYKLHCSVCMNFIVTALVQCLIIIVQTIIYMKSQFHDTFITLVKKKVYDVYFIPTNILLHRYNLYNHIWLNEAINLYSVSSTDNTQTVHKVHVMHIC